MTFVQSGIEFLCSQDVQYLPDVCKVLFSTLGKYKNIVKVHQDELPNIGPEYSVHNALKNSKSFVNPKGRTLNSYSPMGVLNAVLAHSVSCILI